MGVSCLLSTHRAIDRLLLRAKHNAIKKNGVLLRMSLLCTQLREPQPETIDFFSLGVYRTGKKSHRKTREEEWK